MGLRLTSGRRGPVLRNEILETPDVAERVELYNEHRERAVEQIRRCASVHGNLVVFDLRALNLVTRVS